MSYNKPIRRIAVVGTGVIGASWAAEYLARIKMDVEHYNIMGVAKAALESAVRDIAAELGPIRVHAISPGPLATRAASGIPEFDDLLEKAKAKAPTHSLVSIDDVGLAVTFLAHDAARLLPHHRLVAGWPRETSLITLMSLPVPWAASRLPDDRGRYFTAADERKRP